MPLPIFYRYLIRETATLFVAINLILLAIILSFRLSSLLARAISGGISLNAVWQLLGFQAVSVLVILIPIALVLAGVMTLSRMYRDQEISALSAGGIGRGHLLKAMLLLAFPVAILVLGITLFVQPKLYEKRNLLLDQARDQASYQLITPNTFRSLDDGTVIYTGKRQQQGFDQFVILQEDPVQGENSLILADYGHFQENNNERFLTLEKGIRATWQEDLLPQNMSYGHFVSANLHLPNSESKTGFSLRTIPTLKLNHNPKQQAELQNRLNTALALLIFVFSIPLFSWSGPRQGSSQKLLPTFIAFGLYINLLDSVVKAIGKGKLAIWPGSLSVHAAAIALIALWWWLNRRRHG